jgi:hypothetical protein
VQDRHPASFAGCGEKTLRRLAVHSFKSVKKSEHILEISSPYILKSGGDSRDGDAEGHETSSRLADIRLRQASILRTDTVATRFGSAAHGPQAERNLP